MNSHLSVTTLSTKPFYPPLLLCICVWHITEIQCIAGIHIWVYSELSLIGHNLNVLKRNMQTIEFGGLSNQCTASINSCPKLMADEGVWWIKWSRINENSLYVRISTDCSVFNRKYSHIIHYSNKVATGFDH